MNTIKFIKRPKSSNIVLALGTFDGVHKGHAKVINEAVKYARRNKLPAFAMTFDPHPQEVIAPGRGLSLLTTLDERIDLMKKAGLDGVIVKKFDRSVAALSPEEFIKDFLIDQLNVKKVFIGYDFAFGKGRSGSISLLKKMGLEVHAVAPVKAHGHLVKSSTIRSMIASGGFDKAIRLLGHSYVMTGKVVRGRGRGTKLGFPTANIEVAKDKLIPAYGVYAAMWGKRKCVINIGSRPTFSDEQFAIEVHIPSFRGNLRGKTIQVELFKRLRDEFHFTDIEKLKQQIAKDVIMLKNLKLFK